MSIALNHPGLAAWLDRGERGSSSNAIVEQLLMGGGETFHPLDPYDFRRCELLLRAVPTLRPMLPKMAKVSPEWGRLIERWPDILHAMDVECPNWPTSPRWTARMAYAIMCDCRKATA